jgi:hypothetical protein
MIYIEEYSIEYFECVFFPLLFSFDFPDHIFPVSTKSLFLIVALLPHGFLGVCEGSLQTFFQLLLHVPGGGSYASNLTKREIATVFNFIHLGDVDGCKSLRESNETPRKIKIF